MQLKVMHLDILKVLLRLCSLPLLYLHRHPRLSPSKSGFSSTVQFDGHLVWYMFFLKECYYNQIPSLRNKLNIKNQPIVTVPPLANNCRLLEKIKNLKNARYLPIPPPQNRKNEFFSRLEIDRCTTATLPKLRHFLLDKSGAAVF